MNSNSTLQARIIQKKCDCSDIHINFMFKKQRLGSQLYLNPINIPSLILKTGPKYPSGKKITSNTLANAILSPYTIHVKKCHASPIKQTFLKPLFGCSQNTSCLRTISTHHLSFNVNYQIIYEETCD